MCGISGVLLFEDIIPSPELLQAMTDPIWHRGPDDVGYYADKHIGLGFRRLSIIDLQEGAQPLCNEDESVWIVFNGEIYNYRQLRSELEALGHRFRTNSDTEVIVHLYEQYGESCVTRLRGMFGFVLWDRNQQRMLGARDHFGIKPFYYYKNKDRFMFASEIKSILSTGAVARSVRTESLLDYLTFQFTPEPGTMFQHIYKLPPGHTVVVDTSGQMTIRRYWEPLFEPKQRPIGDYIAEIRERLLDSVAHHMQSDVARGCFLSSGIDSTCIASYMRSREPVKTFSVGFAGERDETMIAGLTAQHIGTEHYARTITESDYFRSVPRAVWHQDEPVADPAAIALYHVAELASQHVKVVLSGEGADELFGGYRIYREPSSLRPLAWLPPSLKRLLRLAAQWLPAGIPGRNYVLRGTQSLEERFVGNAKIFTEDMKAEIVSLSSEALLAYKGARQITDAYYRQTTHLDPVTRMQHIDMNLWLPGDILMKADKMTMAHSLELRVPFLDKELFELARLIPSDYLLRQGTTKYIFRKAMEGIVPDFIVQRPKLGFPVPLREWLRGKRGVEIVERIEASGVEPYFNLKTVKAMHLAHRDGKGDYSRKLWAIYIFALWHTLYIQGERADVRADSQFKHTQAIGL